MLVTNLLIGGVFCWLDGSNLQKVATAVIFFSCKDKQKTVCHQKCVTDGLYM